MLATREGCSAFAPLGYRQRGNLHSLTFARRFGVAFLAPQKGESEDFQKRGAKGLAAPSYYEPIFQEQRQGMEREAEVEQRQLAATQV